MHEAENYTEVNARLVKHLVSSVKVYEDNCIEVELNYGEQRSVFNQIIAEMAGDGCE